MPPSRAQRVLFALLLLLGLGLMVGTLSYQAPVDDSIAVGWLGDQLFLRGSAGLGQDAVERGDFYADSLTPDSPTGRSRWTRQHAALHLPNLGAGTAIELTLLAQGWPADIVREEPRQPIVTLRADGYAVGVFTPTAQWEEYTFVIPARLRQRADVRLDLETSHTFTDTLRGVDPRLKGVRLAEVRARGVLDGEIWQAARSPGEQFAILVAQVQTPAWRAVVLLLVALLLLYMLFMRLWCSVEWAFVLTALAAGVAGAGLALLRIWMGAVLEGALWVLAVALLLAWHRPLLVLLRGLVWRYTRGGTLNYGLVVAGLAWAGYAISRGITSLVAYFTQSGVLEEMFPDSLLVVLLAMSVLALLLVRGREGLPRLSVGIVRCFASPRVALAVALLSGGIWIGYQALVIYQLPYVGHADYADNAVVARNLVAGRGWVVDYVTQFYQLYEDTTRPQETWPLLQPVWIAPFLAVFGEHAWAARLPNLLFSGVLLLLIFIAGARLWDGRVGATAALLTLTSHLFFKLNIYATSDLGFVVFSFGALFLLYRGGALLRPGERSTAGVGESQRARFPLVVLRRYLLVPPAYLAAAGGLTGLMMLQKPASALIAVGMGVWLLMRVATLEREQHRGAGRGLWPLARRVALLWMVWALPAMLLLMPYIARNLSLFGTPVYSTERYDAWVLGYRGTSETAWDDIYRVYAPEAGGQGVPDRSWILRWGFDQTLTKLENQVTAVRDYLMPAWQGVPRVLVGSGGHIPFLSHNENKNLLSPPGAWLALLGVVAGVSLRRRLMGLLTLAFVPYMLFLIVYWHTNEERYFVMMIPWLALLVAWMIWAGFDRLSAIGDGIWSPLALLLVGVALVDIVSPSWPIIQHKVDVEPGKWAPDLAAYEWLRNNTPPDAVMMTRNPWQLNWHANRPAVMIPNTGDRETFFSLARHYEVDYLVFETIQRIKGDTISLLAPLLNNPTAQVGDVVEGFRLVYATPTEDNRVLIYQFPETVTK